MSDNTKSDRHSPLKKSTLYLHSEAELEKAGLFAMERCPDVVAMIRDNVTLAEPDRLAALWRLNEAMQIALPGITLVEMADVTLFIATKVHPLSDKDLEQLDAMMARSIKNRDTIKARNANRNN